MASKENSESERELEVPAECRSPAGQLEAAKQVISKSSKGTGRERTGAVGGVGACGAAGGGEGEGEGGVDLDAQVGVVLVLDEDAQALGALPEHLPEAAAAVGRRRARLPLHVLQARRQPHQLVRALRLVRVHVAARQRRRRRRRHRHDHRPLGRRRHRRLPGSLSPTRSLLHWALVVYQLGRLVVRALDGSG
jgi:hypothetical protein